MKEHLCKNQLKQLLNPFDQLRGYQKGRWLEDQRPVEIASHKDLSMRFYSLFVMDFDH